MRERYSVKFLFRKLIILQLWFNTQKGEHYAIWDPKSKILLYLEVRVTNIDISLFRRNKKMVSHAADGNSHRSIFTAPNV